MNSQLKSFLDHRSDILIIDIICPQIWKGLIAIKVIIRYFVKIYFHVIHILYNFIFYLVLRILLFFRNQYRYLMSSGIWSDIKIYLIIQNICPEIRNSLIATNVIIETISLKYF